MQIVGLYTGKSKIVPCTSKKLYKGSVGIVPFVTNLAISCLPIYIAVVK